MARRSLPGFSLRRLLAALDAPTSIKHAGRVLHEVASTVSDTEADEMEEHLRGLGYLG